MADNIHVDGILIRAKSRDVPISFFDQILVVISCCAGIWNRAKLNTVSSVQSLGSCDALYGHKDTT